MYVRFFLILYVTNFLILLQYNIRPPDPNCDVCDPEFAVRLNQRKHDISQDPKTYFNVNCNAYGDNFLFFFES